ncbi:MAG TPA: cupredoxin domain-containing protein [Tepidiformaceae bacterium]|nr:cupredoxin domain-containing protein [Tepidiformaceae bacterium]
MIHLRFVVTRALPAFASIAALAVLAAACSSSGSSSTPTPTSAPSQAPSASASAPASASAAPSSGAAQPVTLQISAEAGNKYDKNTLTVPAGAHVTVQFDNTTDVIHNFSIYDKKGGTELYTGDLFKGPNVTKDEKFTAPAKAGNYYFQCDVHPDTMFGTLVVQ